MSVEWVWERTRRVWSNVYRSTSAVSFVFFILLHDHHLSLQSSWHCRRHIYSIEFQGNIYIHTHACTLVYIQSPLKDDAKAKFIYSNDLKPPVSIRCERENENSIDHIARASRLVSYVVKTYVQGEPHDCSSSPLNHNRLIPDCQYHWRLNSHADQLPGGESIRISTRKERVSFFHKSRLSSLTSWR